MKLFVIFASVVLLILEHIVFFGFLKSSFAAYIFFSAMAYISALFFTLRQAIVAARKKEELRFGSPEIILFIPLLVSPITAFLAYGFIEYI